MTIQYSCTSYVGYFRQWTYFTTAAGTFNHIILRIAYGHFVSHSNVWSSYFKVYQNWTSFDRQIWKLKCLGKGIYKRKKMSFITVFIFQCKISHGFKKHHLSCDSILIKHSKNSFKWGLLFLIFISVKFIVIKNYNLCFKDDTFCNLK